MSYHHTPGKPPGEWGDEKWRRRYEEAQDQHILQDVIVYLKERKAKGFGVSLYVLSRDIKHRREVIKRVVEKHNGTWIDGVLGKFETPRGYYVAWCRVGEDPILCLHWDGVTIIPVQQDQRKVTCPECGAEYLIKRLCVCGAPLREEGENLYCDECLSVFLKCGEVFKRVLPTIEETVDLLFSKFELRSPRRVLIELLDQLIGKERPRLPCELIKDLRNALSRFGSEPLYVERT